MALKFAAAALLQVYKKTCTRIFFPNPIGKKNKWTKFKKGLWFPVKDKEMEDCTEGRSAVKRPAFCDFWV